MTTKLPTTPLAVLSIPAVGFVDPPDPDFNCRLQIGDMQNCYTVWLHKDLPPWGSDLRIDDLLALAPEPFPYNDNRYNYLFPITRGKEHLVHFPIMLPGAKYLLEAVTVEPRKPPTPAPSPQPLLSHIFGNYLAKKLGLDLDQWITAIRIHADYNEYPKLVVEYMFTDEVARKLGWKIDAPTPTPQSATPETVQPQGVSENASLWKRCLAFLRPRTGRKDRKTVGRGHRSTKPDPGR